MRGVGRGLGVGSHPVHGAGVGVGLGVGPERISKRLTRPESREWLGCTFTPKNYLYHFPVAFE